MMKMEKKSVKKYLGLALCLVALFSLAACGGKNQSSKEEGKTDGVPYSKDEVTVGQTWVINDTNPLDGANPWSITSHGISEYVYMIQPDGSLESRFIEKLDQVDDLNWQATMKEDAKFADGSDVKAEDLCKSMNTVMEKNELSNATAGKMVFTPTGDYSFTVKTQRPTKVLQSVLAEWSNVVFKEEGGEYIFTGPFKVADLKPGAELVLEPNEYYPEADKRPKKVVVKAFKDNNALKLAYESGDIDLAFGLTGEIASQLKEEGKNILDFPAGYQYFTFLNMDNDKLSSKNVREALSLALDRKEIIQGLKGGEEPTGLFAGYNSFAGDIKPEFNLDKAKELLDKEGWTLDGNYRAKEGKPLEFKIVTYSSKADLPVLSQIIASQLEKLGVKASVEVVDNIGDYTESKNYDIMVYAQHPSPTGEPSFFLNQFFRSDGSNNFTGFKSQEVDQLLDKLGTLSDQGQIDATAKEIQTKVVDEYPLLLTVDPQWHAGVSETIKGYQLWGGDYFIINSSLKLAK